MQKVDLSQITFIIPFRLDVPDRLNNLSHLINYLSSYFITNIKIWEFDTKKSGIGDINTKNLEYKYFKTSDDYFHKAEYINRMVNDTTTEYICIQDTDIFLKVYQYILALKLLVEGLYEVVLPFDKKCLEVEKKYLTTIKEKKSLDLIPEGSIKLFYNWCVSGSVFWNKASFYKIGMMNESFKSLGGQDTEIMLRAEILELKMTELEGHLYHIAHERVKESVIDNKGLKYKDSNKKEKFKILGLNKEKLKKYISTWQFLKKYK